MSIRSTSESHREDSKGASVIPEIERSGRKHQRPDRGRKRAPIVLMMLPYGVRIINTIGAPCFPRWGRQCCRGRATYKRIVGAVGASLKIVH